MKVSTPIHIKVMICPSQTQTDDEVLQYLYFQSHRVMSYHGLTVSRAVGTRITIHALKLNMLLQSGRADLWELFASTIRTTEFQLKQFEH